MLRPVLRLLPALLIGLALAAAGAAHPRAGAGGHLPPGVTEVAICADEAGRTILIDAHGVPVAPDAGGPGCPCQPCSDCLAAAGEALPAAPASLAAPAPAWRAAEPDRGRRAAVTFLLTPNARGPPTPRI